MLYDYQYTVTGGVHCFQFSAVSLKLTLTPSSFIINDWAKGLDVLCIDLVRPGDKLYFEAGETVCQILKDFINNNRQIALSYYPGFADNKDISRIKLFDAWISKFIETDEILKYSIRLYFPGSDNSREMLALQVFMHNEFPKKRELLNELTSFSDKLKGQ